MDAEAIRVTQVITTLARGGAQATVVASAHSVPADAESGRPAIEVGLLAGADDTGEGSFWDDPALDGADVTVVADLVRRVAPARDQRALRELVRHLRATRPDVVHTHSSKAGVLGRLAAAITGVACVHTVHGWGPLDAGGPAARRAVVGLERALARTSAALVVVGLADLERGLGLGIGRPDQYHVIRSGIELPERPGRWRDEVRRELGLDRRWVVGMVGRLAAQKDQASLIEAFARVGQADATLVLVGDGPTRPALEERAAAHPSLDIRFLGSRPDGARLVSGFDVAVNASHWEGLPRSVIEAAASGVPVVASDVGSTSEVIRPGRSGRLTAPGDVEALARALAAIRRNRVETERLTAEAGRLVQDFSAQRMRADLHELWSSVAGRPAAMSDASPADPTGRGRPPVPPPRARSGDPARDGERATSRRR